MARVAFGDVEYMQAQAEKLRKQTKPQRVKFDPPTSGPGYQNYGANQPTQGSTSGVWYTREQQRAQLTQADLRRQQTQMLEAQQRARAASLANAYSGVRNAAGAVGNWLIQTSPYFQAAEAGMPINNSNISLRAHNQQQQYQMYGTDTGPAYYAPGARPAAASQPTQFQLPLSGPGAPITQPMSWAPGAQPFARGTSFTLPYGPQTPPGQMTQQQLRQYNGLDDVETGWLMRSIIKDNPRLYVKGGQVPPKDTTTTGSSGDYGYGYGGWGGGGGGGYEQKPEWWMAMTSINYRG